MANNNPEATEDLYRVTYIGSDNRRRTETMTNTERMALEQRSYMGIRVTSYKRIV
jgi:hypothetical protein